MGKYIFMKRRLRIISGYFLECISSSVFIYEVGIEIGWVGEGNKNKRSNLLERWLIFGDWEFLRGVLNASVPETVWGDGMIL